MRKPTMGRGPFRSQNPAPPPPHPGQQYPLHQTTPPRAPFDLQGTAPRWEQPQPHAGEPTAFLPVPPPRKKGKWFTSKPVVGIGAGLLGLMIGLGGGGADGAAAPASTVTVTNQTTVTAKPSAAPTVTQEATVTSVATVTASTTVTASATVTQKSTVTVTSIKPFANLPAKKPIATKPVEEKPEADTPAGDDGGYVYYKNCTEVRAAGKAPIRRGDPGYGRHLDRDGDGQGCAGD